MTKPTLVWVDLTMNSLFLKSSRTLKITYLDPDSGPDLYLITIENDPGASGVPETTPLLFPFNDFGRP